MQWKSLPYQQHNLSNEKHYFFKKAQWKSMLLSYPFLSFPYFLNLLCCSAILMSCLLPSCPPARSIPSYMLQMRLFPSFWTNVVYGNPQQEQQQHTCLKSWERSSQLKRGKVIRSDLLSANFLPNDTFLIICPPYFPPCIIWKFIRL